MASRNRSSSAGGTIASLIVLAIVGYGLLHNNGKLPSLDDITGMVEQTTAPSGRQMSAGPETPGVGGAGSGAGGMTGPMWAGLHMTPAEARKKVAHLPIKPAASMAGYERDEQFPTWEDADEHGWKVDLPDDSCDVRAAALTRVGKNVKYNEYCTVVAGRFVDPYTGETTTDPHGLDVDHVVPLAAAYRAGADKWTVDQGATYANDPLVVVPAGASENREKGDKGPQAWKPTNQKVWCGYATRWIAIKAKYKLHLVSGDERDALNQMLDTCPGS